MNENISTYKDAISKNGFFIATPVGISMLPLIREGRDTVKLVAPNGRVNKYDVILFKRLDGKNVLHRVLKVRKKSYDLCGDNQVVIEHGVTDDMIIGVMEGFYRDEEYVSIQDPNYIKYVKKRVRSRKWRYIGWFISRVLNKLKIMKK